MKKRSKSFLKFLASVILFLAVLEGGARVWFLFQNDPSPKAMRFGDVTPGKWKNLPYLIPLTDGRVKRALDDGTVIMDVPYSIDEMSRRKSILPAGKTDHYLLFVGCSFTFGSGVLDHETLPSATQKALPGYRSYNYGFGGATPQEMLLRLKNISPDEIRERDGRIIYTFISAHFYRYFWNPEFVAMWGDFKRVYEFKDDVIDHGTFAEVYPYKTLFYRMRNKSAFYQLLKPHFPSRYTREDIFDFANHLKLMDQEALRISGKHLVFLIWPETNNVRLLKEILKDGPITVLDYSKVDLARETKGKDRIPLDGHPTSESYAVIGKLIARDVRIHP